MAINLLRQEKISTTLAKAKELRRLIDKLINLGKKQDFDSRRAAFKILQDRQTVEILFKDIALRFKEAGSGYTRIIHFKNRRGDNAQMAIIELTVLKPKEKKPVVAKKKKEVSKAETKEERLKKEEKITEAQIKEEKKEALPTKEEKKPVEEKKVEKPKPEKEVKKAEVKETPASRKEKPKGFLDGIRGLFKRSKKNRKEE